MKSIFEMTGPERAAALMVALGPDMAADIIKHLDEKSIEKLTTGMAKIQRLSAGDKEELIGEFLINLRKAPSDRSGGENTARTILVDAFGREKADEIMTKLEEKDIKRAFSFLEELDVDLLVKFLSDENPQTIAVALGYLPADRGGKVLKSLDTGAAKEVALRMARMDRVSPEAVVSIARGIRKKYEKFMKGRPMQPSANGIDSLINILQHMPAAAEKKILENLDTTIPLVAGEVRDHLFAFENVVILSNKEMRILIDEVEDDHTIATALKGAGDEIRFKFLRNMSQNRATDILQEMKAMGPIRLTEVEECRAVITDIMRTLHDDGVIQLKKGTDTIIE